MNCTTNLHKLTFEQLRAIAWFVADNEGYINETVAIATELTGLLTQNERMTTGLWQDDFPLEVEKIVWNVRKERYAPEVNEAFEKAIVEFIGRLDYYVTFDEYARWRNTNEFEEELADFNELKSEIFQFVRDNWNTPVIKD